mmetsp:Transcript_27905/g.70093  ORF Transcript_27905/g.70093 Transcript_27905/m.70093 type:complete len:363 (-) Transcript_27905:1111-2199(-)
MHEVGPRRKNLTAERLCLLLKRSDAFCALRCRRLQRSDITVTRCRACCGSGLDSGELVGGGGGSGVHALAVIRGEGPPRRRHRRGCHILSLDPGGLRSGNGARHCVVLGGPQRRGVVLCRFGNSGSCIRTRRVEGCHRRVKLCSKLHHEVFRVAGSPLQRLRQSVRFIEKLLRGGNLRPEIPRCGVSELGSLGTLHGEGVPQRRHLPFRLGHSRFGLLGPGSFHDSGLELRDSPPRLLGLDAPLVHQLACLGGFGRLYLLLLGRLVLHLQELGVALVGLTFELDLQRHHLGVLLAERCVEAVPREVGNERRGIDRHHPLIDCGRGFDAGRARRKLQGAHRLVRRLRGGRAAHQQTRLAVAAH